MHVARTGLEAQDAAQVDQVLLKQRGLAEAQGLGGLGGGAARQQLLGGEVADEPDQLGGLLGGHDPGRGHLVLLEWGCHKRWGHRIGQSR